MIVKSDADDIYDLKQEVKRLREELTEIKIRLGMEPAHIQMEPEEEYLPLSVHMGAKERFKKFFGLHSTPRK